MVGTHWELQNSKDPNTALSLKENKLGFLGAYYITSLAEENWPDCVCHPFLSRLMCPPPSMRPVGTYYLSMKQGSLRMFGATVWKLLIIESFSE
jgi:hypothetical protein